MPEAQNYFKFSMRMYDLEGRRVGGLILGSQILSP